MKSPIQASSEYAVRIPQVRVTYAFWKRVLDIVGSIFLILLLSPVLIAIALLVKLTSPGGIIYRSPRVGKGGAIFPFLKFRSMYKDADGKLAALLEKNEKDGPIFKMKHDPRITPVGRVLRKYSLDELPQLFNVLRGEMSLVGPRPPIPREVDQYDEKSFVRLSVTPGITCLWQICGRSDTSFQEWMALDTLYVEQMSFWLDLKILLKTPTAVLRGDGAY
ncbi:MAG TPA: exopolysaccharide biosynthesis polyprenyl glycosylphosphotransferase [Fimbriimonadales bacterium]|jgi:exopolysaccharide biosynthesis polyprenyl glycosylphosphotransferase|nr:exopolysaccharide biosynthesis polyprenyl glycosylphosphotransferase [Fimbriimonadales bacterium]